MKDKKEISDNTKVTVSLSLPKHILDDIDELAARDSRNRSNFIQWTLMKLIEKSQSTLGKNIAR